MRSGRLTRGGRDDSASPLFGGAGHVYGAVTGQTRTLLEWALYWFYQHHGHADALELARAMTDVIEQCRELSADEVRALSTWAQSAETTSVPGMVLAPDEPVTASGNAVECVAAPAG